MHGNVEVPAERHVPGHSLDVHQHSPRGVCHVGYVQAVILTPRQILHIEQKILFSIQVLQRSKVYWRLASTRRESSYDFWPQSYREIER